MQYILSVLALASTAIAASSCPGGSGESSINDYTFCCPGSLYTSNTNGEVTEAACIVRCDVEDVRPDCWPLCEDGDQGYTTTATAPAALLSPSRPPPVTTDDSNSATTTDKGKSTFDTSSSFSTIVPTSTADDSRTSPSSSGTLPTSSSSGGGAPLVTQGPVLALAGALAGLALLQVSSEVFAVIA
ncbi:hypothetical protein GGR57DRAFT_504641 [Xylariaceae sp. FL1272]|nr:hypothetical protein GGR57DRAFT_504641 [Xylariaceae sp. FL1272]